MRNYLIVLILLISCNSSNQVSPKYDEYKTDLERNFINGAVESIELFKANFNDESKTEKPILQSYAKYDTSGNQIEFRQNDNFGKELSHSIREYINGNMVKESSFSSENVKLVVLNHYDSIGHSHRSDMYINDTLKGFNVFRYDSVGNVKELSQFNALNKIVSKSSCIYDLYKKDKYKTKIQVDSSENNNDSTIYKNVYDKSDRLVESVTLSKLMGISKSVNQYDDKGFIEKITSYKNGQIDQEKTYDKHHNILQISTYENEALVRTIYYIDYLFDKNGNWIERTAKIDNKLGREKGEKALYKEYRKIKYFKKT